MVMSADPLAGYTFMLEIDGISQATFREGSGFESSVDVIESREVGPGGAMIVKKLPGGAKWSDITLKRGTTASLDLWNWHKMVLDGDMAGARRNGSIVVYDARHAEVARYNLANAWVSRWKGADLSATNNEVAVEEITIVHEELRRVK